jgi:hypothetical protein
MVAIELLANAFLNLFSALILTVLSYYGAQQSENGLLHSGLNNGKSP